jgi:hypothetical protein
VLPFLLRTQIRTAGFCCVVEKRVKKAHYKIYETRIAIERTNITTVIDSSKRQYNLAPYVLVEARLG